MTLRKWFHLFWTTMAIGIVMATAIGLILQFSDQEFSVMGMSAVGFNVINMILGGATISVLSQMGFFAYLIVRFIAMGIFRNKWIWDMIQIILVVVVIVDLAVLRYMNFEGGGSLLSYSVLPVVISLISVAIAYWKVKLTNRSAFIPTLFFMAAVSTLEAVPALKLDNAASTLYMLIPLLACNAYQIMTLHKIVQNKKS